MGWRVLLATLSTITLSLVAACAVTPTPAVSSATRTRVPTLPPLPSATPETPTRTATPVPTATLVPPTATPSPTFTPSVVASTTLVAENSPTPTRVPTASATPTPPPSPTPAFPPGLYVTNLRIDPFPPVRGAELNFYATFANTAGSVYNPRWVVYIYKADTPNRTYGETTVLQSSIPGGTTEIKSLGYWKLPLGGPCDYFFARVASLDINNRPVMYTSPDGAVFEKGFTVCPP